MRNLNHSRSGKTTSSLLSHLLLAVCAVSLFACKPAQKIEDAPVEVEITISDEAIQKELNVLLTHPDTATIICLEDLPLLDSVKVYYGNHDLQWLDQLKGDGLYTLLGLFKEALPHGLTPHHYYVDLMKYEQSRLAHMKDIDSIHRHFAALEILLTHSFLSLSKDVKIGRTRPKQVYGDSYALPLRQHPDFEFYKIIDVRNKEKYIHSLQKDRPNYFALQKHLVNYINQQNSGIEWVVPDTTGILKLEKGDSTPVLKNIAHKLMQMGEIDSAVGTVLDSFHYTKNWYIVIKGLQEKYGLYADGVIGSNTFGIIRTSLDEKINEYRANLERLRWFDLPEEKPFVQVNLPEYKVYMNYEDSVKNMRVCIGKKRSSNYDRKMKEYLESETKSWYKRPKDHETPQIHSKIEYLVINPTWTVPNSIVSREMYWKMRRDSTYLEKGGYRVYYKKQELKRDSIDWSQFKANKIPFRIVQDPSSDNSLGRIKFIFRNKHHIYLHDTPLKSKFKLSNRSVSHGCVRLEDPINFLEFVSHRIEKYDYDDIRIKLGYEPLGEERLEDWDPQDTTAEIQPTDETETIFLQKPVPIYFTYRTIWLDELGNVQTRFDIYRKNRLIIDALDSY